MEFLESVEIALSKYWSHEDVFQRGEAEGSSDRAFSRRGRGLPIPPVSLQSLLAFPSPSFPLSFSHSKDPEFIWARFYLYALRYDAVRCAHPRALNIRTKHRLTTIFPASIWLRWTRGYNQRSREANWPLDSTKIPWEYLYVLTSPYSPTNITTTKIMFGGKSCCWTKLKVYRLVTESSGDRVFFYGSYSRRGSSRLIFYSPFFFTFSFLSHYTFHIFWFFFSFI